MAKIITNQTNTWGIRSGPEVQRSDLWVVDFSLALAGLSNTTFPSLPTQLPTYFAKSVNLPDLKIRSEPIRRDSRPFQMPSWDEPLEGIKMIFWLDCYGPGGANSNPYSSTIYKILDAWRAITRAGRGSMSNEFAITLDNTYRIDFAFDVLVTLLRGSSNPTRSGYATPTANQSAASAITNDLEVSLQLRLVNCWLGSFKTSELDYEMGKLVQLDTTFYADDILQTVASGPAA